MSLGPFFEVPAGTRPAQCRSCLATIYWIETASGRRMPVDCEVDGGHTPSEPRSRVSVDGTGVSHFATCPNADEHRRARR